jgi:opacity protein-like surface antigen
MKQLLSLVLAGAAAAAIAADNVPTTGAPATAAPATVAAPTAAPAGPMAMPTTTPENTSSVYVGAGFGLGWNNQSTPTAAFRLDGGYMFDPVWGIEIGTTGLTQSGGQYNQNMQYYDISVKGQLPLGDTTDLFAQIGGAYGAPGPTGGSIPTGPGAGFAINQSSWSFMSGVGVDFNLNKNLALNLSDIFYYGTSAGIQGNTNVLLIGAKYKFN